MQKLAATAAIGLATLAQGISPATAEPVRLRIGGYAKWLVSGGTNDAGYLAASGSDVNSMDVKGDTEIHILGTGRLDNGLILGFKSELEAGGDTSQSSDPIDKSFVWIEGGFGKIEAGTDYNAASLLHVAAPEAAGLWNGPPVGLMANTNVARPTAVSTMYSGNQTELDHDDNADKVLYFTPNFAGLAAALSYTPSALAEDRREPARASEVYALGLGWNGMAGPVTVAASSGLLTGSLTSASGGSTVRALSAGLQLSYDGVTIGGSVGDDHHDYGPGTQVTTDDSGRSWDMGIMVERGPWALSLDYYHSSVRGEVINPAYDRIDVWQISGKYALGEGVALMAAFGHVNYDDEGPDSDRAAHNDGTSLMTGLGLWF